MLVSLRRVADTLQPRCALLSLLVAISACSHDPSRIDAPLPPDSPLLAVTTQAGDTTVIASDAFSRTVDRGWGSADLGGAWISSTSDLPTVRVSGGQGLISVPNTTTRTASLGQLQAVDGSGLVSFSIGRAPDNAARSHTVDVLARRRKTTAGDYYYRYRVRAFGTGTMDVRIEKKVADASTTITATAVIPAVWQPGARYRLRWDCLGRSPSTVIRMRVWRDGDAEPSGWQLATAVNEPALDVGGAVAVRATAPTSDQITFPITFAFDDFKLFTHVSPNAAPVADAGGPYIGMSGRAVGFDGSRSSDDDPDLPLSYHWSFGDGATSDAAAPTHAYAARGTYAVTLTVTDAWGRSSAPANTSATIDVNDPSVLVKDRFSRTVASGWGTAEAGGPWRIDVQVRSAFRVNGTEAQIVAPDNNPRNAIATEGYGMNANGLASYSIDRAPDDPSRFHTVQVYARRDDRVGDGDNYYRYRVRTFGNGTMDVRVEKRVSAVSTWLAVDKKLPAVFAPGRKFWVRWECIGASPATHVRMRVWVHGTAEPSTWDVDLAVNEPALDRIGTTGFRIQVPSSGQVTFPVIFSFDDLEYRLAP
jgi:PKD domain-containing protein